MLGCEPECVTVVGPDVLLESGPYELLSGSPGIDRPLPQGAENFRIELDIENRTLRASYTLNGDLVREVWKLENRRMIE